MEILGLGAVCRTCPPCHDLVLLALRWGSGHDPVGAEYASHTAGHSWLESLLALVLLLGRV